MSKLWGGVFSEETDDYLANLNKSIDVDQRLYREDIDGSIAYAKGLENVKIISNEELNMIIQGLDQVKIEWSESKIKVLPSDEDVHTVNERRLTELIGPVGGKLHTGRSRNDQVVTDMKLWIKTAIESLISKLLETLKVVVEMSRTNIDVLMPGYTHLQRAQPIRFSHWILSYGILFQSDITRLHDLKRRVDSLPLGSGAIAGNPFNIDRNLLATELKFRHVTPNSMFAVSDRDYIVEFNFVISLISIHLSRLSEDLIIYSTKEFRFVKLSDRFSTGSSLMPQKRNPDSLELTRGLSGEIFGHFSGFMMTLKGLPSTYNKDLQSDKTSMFFVYDKILLGLNVMKGVLRTLEIEQSKCLEALSYDMLATDIAYYLVRKNIPFREAHHISGEVVALGDKTKTPLNELSLIQLRSISDKFDDDIIEIWNFEKSVEQYNVTGGTGRVSVLQQIENINHFIELNSNNEQ